MTDAASQPHLNPQQRRIWAYSDAIMHVIAGTEMGEAQSAMTIAVAAMIVSTYPDKKVWPKVLKGFGERVIEVLEDEDHVAFIKSCIRPSPAEPGHA